MSSDNVNALPDFFNEIMEGIGRAEHEADQKNGRTDSIKAASQSLVRIKEKHGLGRENRILNNLILIFEEKEAPTKGLFKGCRTPISKGARVLQALNRIKVSDEPATIKEAFANIGSSCVDLAKEVGNSTKNFVADHPIATAVAMGVVTGGVAFAAAGPIAAVVGSTGALGAASTGTAIGTLKGAALTSASLAKLGGGAIVAGGTGMTGGTVTVAAAGVSAGAVGGSAASKAADC
ncbi:hypothetical protein [Polaromonas naphthalenivorans]|uniref:Uncharacterized protein n=1 Tax=Polaromonas naphthalenivorans (strain CJ2) TaxID=365044 RepID=A1VWZ9_POLNA|nr:hypothetical protein [Polaromonas naphthalenivorans]ABM40177.1 hypothetical protein Pnap_4768 [Polaromonas naphthalenivorans CJ2]